MFFVDSEGILRIPSICIISYAHRGSGKSSDNTPLAVHTYWLCVRCFPQCRDPSRTDRHHIGEMPYHRAHAHPFHHGETELEEPPFPSSAMRLPCGCRSSFSVLQGHPWNPESGMEAFYNSASSAMIIYRGVSAVFNDTAYCGRQFFLRTEQNCVRSHGNTVQYDFRLRIHFQNRIDPAK